MYNNLLTYQSMDIGNTALEKSLTLKRNSNTTYVKQKEQIMLNRLRKNFSEKVNIINWNR